MKARFLQRIAAIAASASLLAGVGACSSDNEHNANDSSATLKIVTSTKVWADVADLVTDDEKVSIEPIISSADTDPHSYEPSATDMAKVEQADILIAGGGHYDAWLTSTVTESKPDIAIVSALPVDVEHDHAEENHAPDHDRRDEAHEGNVEHGHHHEGHEHADEVNEHVWYDTDALKRTAHGLADTLIRRGATATTEAIDTQLKDINDAKRELEAADVAQVHPLADDILKDTKVKDITPKGYRQATLNESEPSAADINEMLKLIDSGDLDYLIDAPQTRDLVSQRLVEAALARGVKIVNVYESPNSDQSFFDLYKQTLSEMKSV